jgi:hypothetical protein
VLVRSEVILEDELIMKLFVRARILRAINLIRQRKLECCQTISPEYMVGHSNEFVLLFICLRYL